MIWLLCASTAPIAGSSRGRSPVKVCSSVSKITLPSLERVLTSASAAASCPAMAPSLSSAAAFFSFSFSFEAALESGLKLRILRCYV